MQMQLLESPLPPRSVITETFPAPLTSSNCSIAMRAPKLAKLTLGVARIHVCFESPGAPYFFFRLDEMPAWSEDNFCSIYDIMVW